MISSVASCTALAEAFAYPASVMTMVEGNLRAV
ncbi:hypothetical protein FHW19_002741 [Ochrobactrum anthropi]|nr:hypothetical protein [Brucella anthropi]